MCVEDGLYVCASIQRCIEARNWSWVSSIILHFRFYFEKVFWDKLTYLNLELTVLTTMVDQWILMISLSLPLNDGDTGICPYTNSVCVLGSQTHSCTGNTLTTNYLPYSYFWNIFTLKFLFKNSYLCVSLWVFCRMCASTYGDQKTVLDPLELELH